MEGFHLELSEIQDSNEITLDFHILFYKSTQIHVKDCIETTVIIPSYASAANTLL